MMKHLLIITLTLLYIGCYPTRAQVDPTLAAMIAVYTDKAKSELKSQDGAMSMMTTGHLWVKEEVTAATEYQRRYNEYLDSFHDIVAYAAQIYGFYYEVGRLTDNMGALTKQLKAKPDGAVAAALLPNRNRIYRELVTESVDIVNDIRQVCLSDLKMTERERAEIVLNIRPKLQKFNSELQRLTLAVKYSSMSDLLGEIDDGTKVDKGGIGRQALTRWKRAAKR